MGWLNTASRAGLISFFRQNVTHYNDHQTALTRRLAGLRIDTLMRVDRLVGLGVISQFIGRELLENIEDTAIYPLDSFGSGLNSAGGFYVPGETPKIGISNLFRKPASFKGVGGDMRDVMQHEYTHRWVDRVHGGFHYGLTDPMADGGLFGWLEEFWVSHIVQVAINMDDPAPEIMIPDDRDDTCPGSYLLLRTLGGMIATLGSQKITLEDHTRAIFESRDDPRARIALRRKLVANFGEFFPEEGDAAFYNFSRFYLQAGGYKAKEAHVQATIDTIAQQTGIYDNELPLDGPVIIHGREIAASPVNTVLSPRKF